MAALALKLIRYSYPEAGSGNHYGDIFGLDKEIDLKKYERDKNEAHFEVIRNLPMHSKE